MSVEALVQRFEAFSPRDLAVLGEMYAADATFKDPFNDVRGLAAIRHVYAHMFATLGTPRFVVHETFVQGERCVLVWDFVFTLRGRETSVRGASHLVLNAAGRIAAHRDYWDTAEELYEKLPVLGALMRALRRKLSAGLP